MHRFYDPVNFGQTQALNIVAAVCQPKQYSFALNDALNDAQNGVNVVRMPDLTVNLDEAGNIWAARYSSGAIFRHNENYSLIKNEKNQLWFGDRYGAFHPVD